MNAHVYGTMLPFSREKVLKMMLKKMICENAVA